MRLLRLPAPHHVPGEQLHVVITLVDLPGRRFLVKLLEQLDADHAFGQPGHAGRDESTAGADFENGLVFSDIQCLQHSGLDLWPHHALAGREWYRDIGEGELAVAYRDKILSL